MAKPKCVRACCPNSDTTISQTATVRVNTVTECTNLHLHKYVLKYFLHFPRLLVVCNQHLSEGRTGTEASRHSRNTACKFSCNRHNCTVRPPPPYVPSSVSVLYSRGTHSLSWFYLFRLLPVSFQAVEDTLLGSWECVLHALPPTSVLLSCGWLKLHEVSQHDKQAECRVSAREHVSVCVLCSLTSQRTLLRENVPRLSFWEEYH
jgi:hypothetical protein